MQGAEWQGGTAGAAAIDFMAFLDHLGRLS